MNERKKSGWRSWKKKRLINGKYIYSIIIKGKYKSETFLEKSFTESNFPKFLKGFETKYYTNYQVYGYNERNKIFRKEDPRKWKFELKELNIKYNINREKLFFSTKFHRTYWNGEFWQIGA